MKSNARKRHNQQNSRKSPCSTDPIRLGFENKLARYAMAAGAALMLPAAAWANDIVYSGPINQSVSNGGSLSFSPTGTGTDFVLSTYAYDYNGGNGNYNYTGEGYLYTNASGAGVDSSLPLVSGATIGPSSAFFSGNTTLNYQQEYGYSQAYSCGYKGRYTCYNYYGPYYSSSGSVPNNSSSYIGLEFTRNGQTYYGWADIATYVSDGSAQEVLLGYAYDSAPGEGIMAGETANNVTPEPPTLALFALGAVGVLAFSRRRKAISDSV